MAKINEFQKWPTDKTKYDKNYLRLYGKLCFECNGYGYVEDNKTCDNCKGIGYVKK